VASELMQVLTGTGLAGAAGHRAFIPPLALGLMHRFAAAGVEAGAEPWFRLSQKFEWLADTKVMAILAVLALVEYLAEKNPDAPELVTLALKLPKAVSGFLVAAAGVGQVDESLVALTASGVLGTATSLGVDTLRAGVKHAIQQPLSDATHGHSDRVMSSAETAWSGFMTYLAWVIPLLAILALGVLAAVWFGRKKVADAGRVACGKCGYKRHPDAKVCPECKEVV
jgi:hypothetical protein